VYLCVLRCLIFVQIWIHIFFIFDRMIMWLLLSGESLAFLLFGFKLYLYKVKLN
jgi:hypothetical protein